MAFTHMMMARLTVCLALATLLLPAVPAAAQIAAQSGEGITADGEREDMTFLAGDEISVSLSSNDDVFAAGGEIILDGTQADHVFLGAGDVTLRNVAIRDLVAGVGSLTVASGTIEDDLIAFGGNITVDEGASIGGSAVIYGGNLTVSAPVGQDLRMAGGNLEINGDIGGDANLAGDSVVIGPGVTIAGDLTHQAARFEMDDSASVLGEIIVLEVDDKPSGFSLQGILGAFLFALAFLSGLGLLMLAIIALLPGLMASSRDMIRTNAMGAIGIGLGVLIVMPLLAGVLFITMFGAPAGGVLLALYLALLPIGFAAFVYVAGMKLRDLVSKPENAEAVPSLGQRLLWSFLAGLTLLVVGVIPIIGGIIWFIGLVIGLGAVTTRGAQALAHTGMPPAPSSI